MPLKLMYITNDLAVAQIAEKAGVDRIWIDLEILGKEERQKGLNTVKSHHSVEDIKKIAPKLTSSEMMVRVNPWNDNSEAELNQVITAGAQIVMLPMWKNVTEVESFLQAVSGRCKTSLLLETKEAVMCIDKVLALNGIDEIHIGLNDLHLSYGMDFMFELLADGTVEKLCKKIAATGIPYGFGGIAKIGEGILPADYIVTEHYRLGSTRVILSRSFCNVEEISDNAEIEKLFSLNVRKLREFEANLDKLTPIEFQDNLKKICECVKLVVDKKRNNQ
ncbi:aldolase/citrate lyase family protein [Anaerovibrio lipolyticus]|uniref:aldolase/citrate lyase family protein n=1 Tax=Anaerovibrio lipolyticus TaxID=82374 RepID=UPI000489C009|nr:aldolase/citrate lyase family protein [Anaerovibrio lipolyticus]